MMRCIAFAFFLGLMMFVLDALLNAGVVDARGGVRSSSRGYAARPTRMRVSRMKTYHFNGKPIHGYRNFIRERRAAKLASGGYKVRNDGSVVHRDFHIRMGRMSTKPLNLKQAPAVKSGPVQGQCRDGTTIDQSNLDWGCRHAGGIGWSHQPPRLSGVRDY